MRTIMDELRFGQKTADNIPEAFLSCHNTWDNFVSGVWAEVLKEQDVSKKSDIIEIGPGVSTKVGGALANIGFCGRLFVVDPLPDVLGLLKKKYDEILPDADIFYIAQPVSLVMEQLPDSVDIILGSHVLDDMMIYEFEAETLGWSKNYTHEPSQELKRVWNDLYQDKQKLNKIKKDVVRYIIKLSEILDPELVILNQYPSATLQDNKMMSLNENAIDVLETLKASIKMENIKVQDVLDRVLNYNNVHIANNVLNSENWMVCRKK